MRYHDITKCDLKNGMGIRVVLWVSHCDHKCEGCHNQQTWNKESGILFDKNALKEIYDELSKEYVHGLTLTGGDPLSIENRKEIAAILMDIKKQYPDKDIWCYTGYCWEEIKDLDAIKYIDVLVDGKYIQSLNNPSPKWRGSTNQRLINVKETLDKKYLVIID